MLTLLYDLTWKDVMYILGQTLTPKSKTQVLGKAVAYGDEWFCNESVGKREAEIIALPTGNQFSSVQSFSHIGLFAIPRTAALQPPCPSPTPEIYSNSCSLSR